MRFGLEGAVNRDDTAGEVAVLHGGEARLLELLRQFLLVGPGDDGLGKVFVGFGVGGDCAGDRRDRLHDVVLVDRAEGGEGRGRELEDDDASAGLEYAVDFAQCLGVVGDVAQAVGHGHCVEGFVVEG